MELSSMPTRYDASSTEQKWYARWEAEAHLFEPTADPDKPVYTITIPPPNITGSLHMGHALCYPIQDLLGRYNRMLGKNVLVLPGQDHAGIATQSVVDKQLRKQGTSAAQIGREKFVERVWEWRKESGDTILNQLRTLGCGFDWTRTAVYPRRQLRRSSTDRVYRLVQTRVDLPQAWRVVNWDSEVADVRVRHSKRCAKPAGASFITSDIPIPMEVERS